MTERKNCGKNCTKNTAKNTSGNRASESGCSDTADRY